ncbi:threonine/serine dehydratase [Chloroflexi bacterium TSY]|nr:threonine/serine dehydratase [Chloroflexi bacterium TSY]
MNPPTIAQIRTAREDLADYIVETPVWQWRNQEITEVVGEQTEVYLKLELFQHTGTFKSRGALINALGLSKEDRLRGFTAVSAGNHAIAVAFAANLVGTTAKVVMPKTANPIRVQKCRAYGADVILVDDVSKAFAEVERIEQEEGRFFIHPFESLPTILGTSTVGLEWCAQVPELDAVIVPIGGGGLCAGIATAVKLLQPNCKVYGVEPEGADTMRRSLQAGSPQSIEAVETIADSLGAPYAAPYSMSLCQRYVDDVVLISDIAMQQAQDLLFHSMKLAVEPAGAAATAALIGPLLEELRGKRVGVIVCGSNIDIDAFATQVNIGHDSSFKAIPRI